MIVVCALEFERDRLLRAGVAEHAEILCCGPGGKRISAWADGRSQDERPIVLAGLAGGLTERVEVGSAWIIREVRAGNEALVPAWIPMIEGVRFATVSCPLKSLTTPEAKRAWHRERGTDLVDLESEAFARAMLRTQRRWAIVRGVSDAVDDALPDSIDSWVDEHGRTRHGFIALAHLRRPSLVAITQRIGKQARQAMDSAAELLHRIAKSL